MTSRPRIRRWFRFSIRGVLVAITVLAVLLGFKVEQVRRQQAVLAWVRQLNGGVISDSVNDLSALQELTGLQSVHNGSSPDK